MASDDVNIAEDAEMAECDGDKVVTMMDVLQEQQEFEEDANAVLGASDDKNCTYPKGYIKRQALYACLTCCAEAKVDPTKRAGVCLACSLNCHENHELIELYTKRNFRCDCGNPKFNSHPCQYTPEKTDLNNDNIYNQNFSGLYCTCQRPYPDPESTIEDDMIQCIICEDWLHASHLEAVVPANDQYSEMICKGCMEKNEFLHDYSMFAVTSEAEIVDIVTVNGDANLCNGDSVKENLVNGVDENKTETTSITVDRDVEMDEDKAKDSTDNKKNEENVAAETNEEANNVESSELKPEDNDKPDNVNNKIDTESKAEGEEQSVGIPELKEQTDTDAPAKPEDDEQKETESNDKSDAAENTLIDETEQNKETSTEKPESIGENPENSDSLDDKTESTDNDPEKEEKSVTEQNEEQISKSDEVGDGDKTDTNEKTEQQLLADLTALTADNPDSTENIDSKAEENTETGTEKKSEENMEQSDDNKEEENVQTNNEESPKDTENQSEDQSNEKPVVDDESATGNIEVPDTSQDSGKENTVEKADSVMDAIDELLQTANEAKEKETDTNESETKENTNTETSDDVEMSTSEKKDDDEVPEKTENATSEPNDKLSTNDTEDIEMSDTTTPSEPASESIVGESAPNENKDANVAEITENESITDSKPEVTDTTNESTSQENISENDDKLTTLNETESSNGDKIELSTDDNEVPVTENGKEHKRKLSTDLTDDISSKKAKLECVRPKGVKRIHKGATFWPSNFRQKLCTCGECLSMYKDLKVLFLTDLEDTVFAYESLGKENVTGGASQYEKGMLALSSLDRIQQINALTEYNRMRDKLLDFLKSFKDRKEIVKEEDIKAFFAGMKPRREPDGVYFCR